MKSIITSVLMNADTTGRFLNDYDCQEIGERLAQEAKRLEFVAKLGEMIDSLVQQSGDMLVKRHPEFKQPGYCGDTPKKVQHWYQDIGDYLRIISYCIIVRSPDPIYRWNGRSVGEFFRALNVPLSSCIEGVTQARDLLLASGEVPEEMKDELNGYFAQLVATFA